MKFRTDINGLRALAIIAVVLFHFNPSWIPGGFAGVDVFFVISGFLMTGLIFRGLENNNFSIINFYVARANRIIPALSVVCLALLVFGWFYLTPLDYRALGKHVASSMGFLSNIIYWRESGYFDTASHSKWLLHTWSLSVEWQFYMIYPVVLVLLKKCMSLTNIKRLLVVGTVVGFIFSVYATYRWPNPAYFLFPTRAWEMMMGGLAFLYPLQNLKETSKKYFEWAGIALILASYAFISKDNLWPGYLALIPVLGAYLVIIANRSGSVITDNVVMQKVGLWSYSIYLWHWPVVVFGYYFEMQHWEWIGIPISVVLGFCSYKFIESIKFPALSSISFKPIATFKPLWMVIIIGLVSSFVFIKTAYFYFYLPSSIYKASMVNSATDHNNDYTWKTIQDYDNKNKFKNVKYKILTIGDSQSGDFVNNLKAVGLNDNVDIVSRIVRSRCQVFDLDNKDLLHSFKNNENIKNGLISEKDCINQVGRVNKDNIIKKANIIILAMYWNNKNLEYILKSIENIRRKNNDALIYVVGGKWFDKGIPSSIYRTYIKNKSFDNYMHEEIPNNDKINYTYQKQFFRKNLSNYNVNFIDMINLICDKNKCHLKDDSNNPFYYDETHTTKYGAYYLGEKIQKNGIFPNGIFKV
jgi:peptidoglycan/LPS O-acetylase OafA/YrhL